jgi:type I restriction enzyme S subunit
MSRPVQQIKNTGEKQPNWITYLPQHWRVEKLKNLASLRFSNVDKHTKEDELPVRLCNYTDVYYNDLITPDLNFMQATATPGEIATFGLRSGDVIVTKDSETWDDIAVPAYVPENLDGVICGYHLAQIRPNQSLINGKYLFRALSAAGIRDQFHIAANGVTRYGLPQYALKTASFQSLPAPSKTLSSPF